MIRAEVISTGSELMAGRSADTNFATIARMLAPLPIEVRYHSTYGDSMEDLTLGVKTALARADLVVMTGGLGPTSDDLTRQAVAEVLHRPLRFRPEVWRRIRSRLRRVHPIQRVQAMLPKGTSVIDNPLGTAPGFWIDHGRGALVALSGVPAEMGHMMERYVLPRLRRRLGTRPEGPPAVLRLFGVPESRVEQVVAPLLRRRGVVHGITARRGHVRLTVPPSAVRPLERLCRRTFGAALYATQDIELEHAVVALLRQRRITLAVAESCTGGLVADRLTNVPGASEVFLDAVVAYANGSKVARLGVRPETLRTHGAVSPAAAAEMAQGACRSTGATAAVSTTGIAGPGGGSLRKPVGLVFVGVHARGRTQVEEFRFRGERREIKERAADAALDLLRWEILRA